MFGNVDSSQNKKYLPRSTFVSTDASQDTTGQPDIGILGQIARNTEGSLIKMGLMKLIDDQYGRSEGRMDTKDLPDPSALPFNVRKQHTLEPEMEPGQNILGTVGVGNSRFNEMLDQIRTRNNGRF